MVSGVDCCSPGRRAELEVLGKRIRSEREVVNLTPTFLDRDRYETASG